MKEKNFQGRILHPAKTAIICEHGIVLWDTLSEEVTGECESLIPKNKELIEEWEGHDIHANEGFNRGERQRGFQDDDEGNSTMTAVRRPKEQQVQIWIGWQRALRIIFKKRMKQVYSLTYIVFRKFVCEDYIHIYKISTNMFALYINIIYLYMYLYAHTSI